MSEVKQPENGMFPNWTSPGMLEPIWDWRESHDARISNLLETGFQSDLTLYLGSDGVKVPVHRIFLQAGSPTLNFKIKVSMEDLVIEDVDSRVFKILLKYLYTGKCNVEMGDALQLMLLAKEYEINGLRDHCAAVLKGDLTCENVLGLFQSGMEYGHGDLIQSSLKFICRNASKILRRDEFSKMRLECLIEIIQQDSLRVISEMEVFETINRWGVAECGRQSLDPENTENLRKCLAKPLNYIRFPLMDPEEFALHVTSKKLLNTDESMELLTCFLVKPDRRNLLPHAKFISRPRTYICKDICLKRTITGGTRIIQNVIVGGNANGEETIMVRVKENAVLKSISVCKDIFNVHGSNYVALYDLIQATITMSDAFLNVRTLMVQTDAVNNDEYLRIDITPPLQLNVNDGWVKVTIRFSGVIGYRHFNESMASRVNVNLTQSIFPANGYNRVVANYEDCFKLSMVNSVDFVDIKRADWDNLWEKFGLIEKLVFELV